MSVEPQSRVASFRAHGFASLGPLICADELDWLRRCYDAVFERRLGVPMSALGRRCAVLPPLLTEVSPDGDMPELRETALARDASARLAELFAVPASHLRLGWRMFTKPPGGAATPWHQDAAYRPPPHHGGSLWIPLDPATRETSCLSFIPGSHHQGLRAHEYHDGHMHTDAVDPNLAISCPLAPGEATAHHCLTLHCAGPNLSARPRRAFVVVAQVAHGPKS